MDVLHAVVGLNHSCIFATAAPATRACTAPPCSRLLTRLNSTQPLSSFLLSRSGSIMRGNGVKQRKKSTKGPATDGMEMMEGCSWRPRARDICHTPTLQSTLPLRFSFMSSQARCGLSSLRGSQRWMEASLTPTPPPREHKLLCRWWVLLIAIAKQEGHTS